MIDKSLLDIIRKIIYKETIWLRHYIGQIADLNDPLQQGRINVVLFDLGCDSAKNGFWCYPRDKESLITPKLNDWVEVYFMQGDRNRPVYIGKANEIQQMLPKNYDGKPTTHILFEAPDNDIHIKFDSVQNLLEIGNSDFQFVGRIGDEVTSDNQADSTWWVFLNAFFGVITGAPIPEPGNGAPSAFQTALNIAITSAGGLPSSQKAKITKGSDQVKVGKK